MRTSLTVLARRALVACEAAEAGDSEDRLADAPEVVEKLAEEP